MTCQELAACVERLQPQAGARDVARLCLLLTNHVENLDALDDAPRLAKAWEEMGLRLQAATDQHLAVTAELEEIARQNPAALSPDQVWVLIRAIKVQSQILQMYVGKGTPEA